MLKCPVDVIQYIALMIDPIDYLNIALTCKHCSGILKQTQKHPRRAKAIRHFTRITIDDYGHKRWRLNGKFHRDNDKPAYVGSNGSKAWYQHGKRHRDNDKPAFIYSGGYKVWYINGKRIKSE